MSLKLGNILFFVQASVVYASPYKPPIRKREQPSSRIEFNDPLSLHAVGSRRRQTCDAGVGMRCTRKITRASSASGVPFEYAVRQLANVCQRMDRCPTKLEALLSVALFNPNLSDQGPPGSTIASLATFATLSGTRTSTQDVRQMAQSANSDSCLERSLSGPERTSVGFWPVMVR